MSEALLVLLVLVWAGLLLPGAVRSRNASPHTTVGGFERAMDVLRNESRGHGREVLTPHDPVRIVDTAAAEAAGPAPRLRGDDPVVARRRAWFTRSLVTTGVAFVVAIVAGGWLWLPFLVSLLLTAGYVVVLRRLKLQRDEARQVVAELDLRREDERLARETGMSGAAVGAEQWAESGTVRLRRWDG